MAEHVGVVGLGAMGMGMATNLMRSGFELVACDPSPARQQEGRDAGMKLVTSPREVAESATDVVFCVVRTKDQARSVILGDDGILAAGSPRTVVVSSTLDPTLLSELAAKVEDAGSNLVDATLSGGSWGAEAGTLTLMVAADPEVVTRVRPHLESLSSRLYVVGDQPGAGQAVKLAVQLSFCIQMLAAYEALQITAAHSVQEDQLMDILTHSVGASWTTENWARVKPWWEFHRPGGDLEIQVKDLRSALEEADREDLSLPVSGVVFQMLREVYRGHTA